MRVEMLMSKSERLERRSQLLEKWRARFSGIFLEMALDCHQFWREWEAYDRENPRESCRDYKLLSEILTQELYRACFNTRLDSLEALAETE